MNRVPWRTRPAGAIALAAIVVFAPACVIKQRLPFYTQSNAKLPAGAAPVLVVHGPPPPGLPGTERKVPPTTARQVLDLSFGSFAALWPDKDPASRNARKLAYLSSGYEAQARAETLHTDPFPDVDVILALSGGGMRAANLSAGVMFELARIRVRDAHGVEVSLLDTVDAVSSVSGGSWAAAFYLYHRPLFGELLNEEDPTFDREIIQIALGENLQRPFTQSILMPHKVSTLVRLTTHASRTTVYSNIIEYAIMRPQRLENAEAQLLRRTWRSRPVLAFVIRGMASLVGLLTPVNLHDQYFFRVDARTFRDLYLEDASGRRLYPLRPEWLVNATLYNAPPGENNFVFDDSAFTRTGSDLLRHRISDAVAASSAFPGAFAPLTWRDWSAPQRRYFFLTDGGVSDNNGLTAARKWMERRPQGRATVLIAVDASPRSGWLDRTKPYRPGILDVTNRAIGGYMSGVRQAALDDYTARSGRNGFTFLLLSIRPEDQRGWTPKPQETGVLEASNRIGTGLKISEKDRDTLFEAARMLVEAHRDEMIETITGAPAVPTPGRKEESGRP